MERAIGYVRVSTTTQVMKGQGIKTQETAIIDYCKRNQLELVNVFRDEGVSGTVVNREGLTDLLDSLREYKKVVVLNTSRLWRSDTVKVLVHRELKKFEADIVSIEQPSYSIYTKDPSDFLINGMMELLDQYERLSIALKLSKGRRTKVRNGVKGCGRAPLGFVWRSAQIEVDEESASIVKLIFRKYLELQSVDRVLSYLDEHGFTTPKGTPFRKQSIVDILKNDFYIGTLRHGDLVLKGTHTQLVSSVVFGKVQAQLKRNNRRSS
ncbi:recombinase family protein [Alicyclobacillus mengziensis]|uniref:Recombinase family protein n=1 Tax=Alicyclobacillus mengziensis TaxID=2931921 RepID=A0A9X7W0F7_9BACL|nr:recombinase family protein [Alicyclobacillus mengziensis]QSO48416.1 recombinase family protein [Alicyclobacillus mengziensis]